MCSLKKSQNLNVKKIVGFFFRVLAFFFFIFLKVRIFDLIRFTQSIMQLINLFLIITILFLIIHLLLYTIEALQLINLYFLKKFHLLIHNLPVKISKLDDFQFVSDATIFTKNGGYIEIKSNKIMSYFSIIQGLTLLIWFYSSLILLSYVGLFTENSKIYSFWNILVILLLLNELFNKKSLLRTMIYGIKYSMNSPRLTVNLDEYQFELQVESIFSKTLKRRLEGDLSLLKQIKTIQISPKSNMYGIFFLETSLLNDNNNNSISLKGNSSIILIEEKSLAFQIESLLKKIPDLNHE